MGLRSGPRKSQSRCPFLSATDGGTVIGGAWGRDETLNERCRKRRSVDTAGAGLALGAAFLPPGGLHVHASTHQSCYTTEQNGL